jgi:hypothetical protein
MASDCERGSRSSHSMGSAKVECAKDRVHWHGSLRYLLGLHWSIPSSSRLRWDRSESILEERQVLVGAASESSRRSGRQMGCTRVEFGDAELGRNHYCSRAVKPSGHGLAVACTLDGRGV